MLIYLFFFQEGMGSRARVCHEAFMAILKQMILPLFIVFFPFSQRSLFLVCLMDAHTDNSLRRAREPQYVPKNIETLSVNHE